jgi:hypothetical protein
MEIKKWEVFFVLSPNPKTHTLMETPGYERCRFYEREFPEIEECVVVSVKRIAEMGAYVQVGLLDPLPATPPQPPTHHHHPQLLLVALS